ncbi:MAG: AMP-binding protein, partial [Verrucomicrobium sp.]
MFKHQLFEEQVRLNPDAPALVSMTQHLTYGELNQLANATARRVQRLGAVPGDIAAVYLRRSVELVVAILALRKAGVACLHLDPDGSQQQVGGLLKLSEAKVILTHERHLKALHVPTAHVVCLDSLRDVIGEDEAGNPEVNLSTHHAESIFCTSGTTGAPKAVVWNFRRL